MEYHLPSVLSKKYFHLCLYFTFLVLSVCPGLITFLYFHVLCLNWCDIENYGWELSTSCLLSKDELLTPNIDEVMVVWFFRRRALKTEIGKIWPSQFWYIICFFAHARAKLLNFLQRTVWRHSQSLKSWFKTAHQLLRNNCAKFGTSHFSAKSC